MRLQMYEPRRGMIARGIAAFFLLAVAFFASREAYYMLLPSDALRVEESGETTAAADLGILQTVDSGRELDGNDINNIGDETLLSWIAAGGLTVVPGPDMRISARDGGSFDVDLDDAVTIGEVLGIINDNTSLEAGVSERGDALVIVDSGAGSGELKVESLEGSQAAEELGLAGSTSGEVLVGKRLVGDLGSVPLERVGGGKGVARGTVRITDRRGRVGEVDLTDLSIETVGDVVEAINSLDNIEVSASISGSGDAIILLDTSGLPFRLLGKEFLAAHVVATGVLVVSIVGVYILVNRPRVAGFLVEVEGELRKVSWPTRREVLGSTVVVLILMAVLSAYIFLADLLLATVFRGLF